MKESLHYEKLNNGDVKCHICPWHCHIHPSRQGYCKTRINREGVLYTLIYDVASSIAVDPIEKKPLFHFFPASQVFSVGTWGCNMRCQHCQNWHISYAQYDQGEWVVDGRREGEGRTLTVEESVALAKGYRCKGIAWTYNEPTIWFEYTLDGARLAKASGLYTVYVTNGYITAEALDALGPYLDAFRVDIKGFTDEFYRRLTRLPRRSWKNILEMAVRAKEKWNLHVEVVTNIIPTYNDDDEQLRGLSRWIKEDLGPETPWHVSRFYPHAYLRHLPPTPLAALERARHIGFQEGLRFIYTGNVLESEGENTYCYQCQKIVIEREGYQTQVKSVAAGGKCLHCGADLNIRGL